MYNRNLIIVNIAVFILELLVKEGVSRAIFIPGTVTETEVTNFEFFQRLANPCGIVRLEQEEDPIATGTHSDFSYTYAVDEVSNSTQFYQSMIISVDAGLDKLRHLQNSNPTMPECKGGRLDTLPPTPSLTTVTDDQLFRELYKSGIFLATHLHIMGLDRQMTVVGVNDVADDNLDEQNDLPSWRYLKCGNESDTFMLRLAELTIQIEDILCTVMSYANLEQRASFRGPFNKLRNTIFYRYHSACSTIQLRDCLVLKETSDTLTIMSRSFNALLQVQTPILMEGGPLISDNQYSHVMTNEI